MYLALNVAALIAFVVALLAALVFSIVWPLALVALAIAVLAAGQVGVGARLLYTSLSIWFGSWGRSYQLVHAVWLATFDGGDDDPPAAQRVPLKMVPALSAVLDELTTALKTGPIASVTFDLEANASVSFGRHLTLGIPYLYLFTGDELRAVLAHEVAHIRAWHTTTGRFVAGCITRLGRTIHTHSFSLLSPVTWVGLGWLAFLEATYFSWRRRQEYEADALAASVAGGDHLISGFRRIREELGFLVACQQALVEHSGEVQSAPNRLVEAAARLAAHAPPAIRMRMSRDAQGDPLESEHRTHPPTPLRIAALQSSRKAGARFTEKAMLEFTDVLRLEEPLTKRALGGRQVVPSREFVASMLTYIPPRAGGGTWRENAIDLEDLPDVERK